MAARRAIVRVAPFRVAVVAAVELFHVCGLSAKPAVVLDQFWMSPKPLLDGSNREDAFCTAEASVAAAFTLLYSISAKCWIVLIGKVIDWNTAKNVHRVRLRGGD